MYADRSCHKCCILCRYHQALYSYFIYLWCNCFCFWMSNAWSRRMGLTSFSLGLSFVWNCVSACSQLCSHKKVDVSLAHDPPSPGLFYFFLCENIPLLQLGIYYHVVCSFELNKLLLFICLKWHFLSKENLDSRHCLIIGCYEFYKHQYKYSRNFAQTI